MAKEQKPGSPNYSDESSVVANLKTLGLVVLGFVVLTGLVFGAPEVRVASALTLALGGYLVYQSYRDE